MQKTIIWILVFILTAAIAVYQRKTGPTYPKSFTVTLNQKSHQLSLPRSHGGEDDKIISIEIPDRQVEGLLRFRRFPTNDQWETEPFIRKDDVLYASLPKQPPAGKLEYTVILRDASGPLALNPEPVIIRFKGHVPPAVLIPHIIFVFAAMLISGIAGAYAAFKLPGYKFYGVLTVCLLFAGGLILGPVIQNYAFGDFWTGFPLGRDMTDNKVLFAFIVWIAAITGNIKKDRPWMTLVAAIFFILVSLIPHSMFGSEYDYESGEVVTGFVMDFLAS